MSVIRAVPQAGGGAGAGFFNLRAPFFLLFNIVAAILIILINKGLFKERHFPAPSLLTSIQYCVIWALTTTKRTVEAAWQPAGVEKKGDSQPRIRNFWLMAVLMGIPVMVSNYSLELNNVGFYQVVKALHVPTIVLMDWAIAGKQPPSQRCLAALVLVVAGVLIATASDVSVQLLGACVALSNLPLQCGQKVLISKHVREGHEPLQLLERLMPASAACLALLSLPLEGRAIYAFGFDNFLLSLPGIFGSALAAFLAQWSSFLVLGSTSALTYQLAGQLKSCVLILGGTVFFHEETSARVIAGASLAIAGGGVYTAWNLDDQKRMKEDDKRRPVKGKFSKFDTIDV